MSWVLSCISTEFEYNPKSEQFNNYEIYKFLWYLSVIIIMSFI